MSLRTSCLTSTIPDFVQQVARYEGDKIKRGGFFWRFKRCCTVACILMHDEFPTAHDVAHRFIEYSAVRGFIKCDDTQECRAVIITTFNFVQQVARY